jgi:hypothetical protein
MKKTPPVRPPLPPLSDAAIERIERGVFAALDARAVQPDRAPVPRRRLVAFAFAGAAVVGAFFGVREWRRGDTVASGPAQLSTTDSGSHVEIAGAVLDVAPHSAVSFGGRGDGAMVVVLDRGTVTCEVAPRTARAPFIVQAGATRVTVIGTRFSVHREGQHATVTVAHGLVEVADTSYTQLVHAGERYRPGEAVTAEPAAPAVAAATPVEAPATPAPAAATAPAAPALVATPTSLPPPPPRTRTRRLAREETGPVEPSKDATRATAAATEESVGAAAPQAPEAAAEVPSAPAEAPAPTSRRSVQVLFELAAQLEVRDPVAALRIYGELAAGDDGWAASALFASARLEAERGQMPRARELCQAYLQRFPRGTNADDARTLLANPR